MEPFPNYEFDRFIQSFKASNGKGGISKLLAIYRIYITCDNYAQGSLSEYMFEVTLYLCPRKCNPDRFSY